MKRISKKKPAKPRAVRRRKPARKPYSLATGVSQTRLAQWVHCPQAARYHLDGWRSPSTKESLAFGGLMHEIFEGLYKRVRAGTLNNDPDLLKKFFDATCRSWRKQTQGWTSPAEAQTVELCLAKAAAIFPGYCEMWKADFDPTIWRELEGSFDVVCLKGAIVNSRGVVVNETTGYRLKGRIDGVREVDGKLWILETKTMGRIDGSLDEALSFDFQTLYYVTAAEAALGRRVEGAIYNVVRRPGHKPKDGESLPAYTARVAAEVAKKPDHFFKRFELTFTKKERARFECETQAKLHAFGLWLEGNWPTWRNEGACRGRWSCDWLPACSSGSMAGYVREV